jgi:hypothetical protein
LRIDHPKPDMDYVIAWEPMNEAEVAKRMGNESSAREFAVTADARGAAILAAFLKAFLPANSIEKWSLALYAYDPAAVAFRLTESCDQKLRPLQTPIRPDAIVECRTSQNALNFAWLGDPTTIDLPPDDANAIRLGFKTGELGLACVPVRFSLRAVNPPPWGILRLAARNEEAKALISPTNNDTFEQRLQAGMAALLAEVLRKGDTDVGS